MLVVIETSFPELAVTALSLTQRAYGIDDAGKLTFVWTREHVEKVFSAYRIWDQL